MKLRVLGCSGGVGAGLRTTSYMVDDDILLDAGSGVGELFLEEMSHIRHIFLSHSHMDHTAFIPFLVDSIFERLTDPIIIHAQQETIDALQAHIFNWVMWPDFSKLPREDNAVLKYEPMKPGEKIWINGRQIEMIAVNHTVPGVGYRVSNETCAFAYSGDTSTNDNFWNVLNSYDNLDLLIVEVAFANRQSKLAQMAKHYCPATLAEDLSKLKHNPDVYITHLKPGEEMAILSEVKAAIRRFNLKTLVGDEVFQL
ncbi:MAG: 3',5'-cyclic-nucleotide phosphodiesterase [Nitrosomonas sp.]|nr:3',5'-cyclic-nucleotide phosphodiesterase [Nitrosomonas sp.]MDH5727719.1 3',5'-cyclic-nucleotide phosphodiesterase [Gammaproteobacteria bacterium]